MLPRHEHERQRDEGRREAAEDAVHARAQRDPVRWERLDRDRGRG